MSDRSTILDLVQRIEALSPEARAMLFAQLLQRQYARNRSATSSPSGDRQPQEKETCLPWQSSTATEADDERALSYLEPGRRELDLETEDFYR